jgi:hypothetical protein
MKSALPWILAAVFLAAAGYLFSQNHSKDEQIAALSGQAADAEKLRAENEQLKQAPDQSAELARLRKDNEDTLQLRSDVNQLRDDNKKLTAQLKTALAQSGQVQQQQQQATSELQSLRSQTQRLQASQSQEHLSVCVNNLRIIQAAKQQWAMDKQKQPTSVPTPDDLAPYLPNNTMPVCPDGGTYTINSVIVPVTCTVPNHVLPR